MQGSADIQGLSYLFFADVAQPATQALPASMAALPLRILVGFVAVMLAYSLLHWRLARRLRPTTLLWAAVFAAALVGLRVLCLQQMVHADARIYTTCCWIAAAGGAACLVRDLFLDFAAWLGARRRGGTQDSDAQDEDAPIEGRHVAEAFVAGRHAKVADPKPPQAKAPRAEGHRTRGRAARAALEAGSIVRDALILAVAAYLCTYAIELPWNETVPLADPGMAQLEYAVILFWLVVLYFVAGRHGIGPALGVVACLLLGMAQYFVTQFRGSPFMPSDLFAIETAASVSAGYTYELRNGPMLAIAWALGALCLMVFVRPPRVKGAKHAVRAGTSLACVAALALGWWAWYSHTDVRDDLGATLSYWQPYLLYESYCESGFVPAFLVATQDMEVKAPSGYNANQASQMQDELAQRGNAILAQDRGYALAKQQFDAELPSVVVVMNETFSDLSLFEGLHIGYEGPEFFNKRFADTLARGSLYVSVHGGGTSNSELEFLAGTTMALVGYGKHPYALYRLGGVHSVVDEFNELGYTTTAMHPSVPSNWHRDIVYPVLGFDRFLDITSFEGASTIRGYTTDEATYDKVLEILQDTSAPQFVFDVTIQNHGGYPEGEVPEDLKTNYHLVDDEISDKDGELSEFLSLISASDVALERFVSQLKTLDRKVLLVFFGDHHPSMTDKINDAIFDKEDPKSLAHGQRLFESVYAIWANYDIAGREGGFVGQLDSSSNNLADIALQVAGAPLDQFALAKLALRQDIPAANVFGYRAADGQWYAWNDDQSPYATQASQLQALEYLNFGSRLG